MPRHGESPYTALRRVHSHTERRSAVCTIVSSMETRQPTLGLIGKLSGDMKVTIIYLYTYDGTAQARQLNRARLLVLRPQHWAAGSLHIQIAGLYTDLGN